MDLETKLRKAHKMYAARVADSPHFKEKIERDYQDFIYALNAVRAGEKRAIIAKEIGRSRRTISHWMDGVFPKYLIPWHEHPTKSIDIESLAESKEFTYILGFYQAKARCVSPKEITIKTREKNIAKNIADSIEAVFGKVSIWKEDSMVCVGYSSKRLMEFIKEITGNNSKVPNYIRKRKDLIYVYLKGFFDSRSYASYHTRRIRNSRFARKFPEMVVEKKNKQLLAQIKELLKRLNIGSSLNENVLIIRRRRNLARFLKLRLVSEPKYGKLKRLHDDYRDLMRIDRCGELSKVMSEIYRERQRIEQEKRKSLERERLKGEMEEMRALEKELLQFLNESADV